MQALTVHLDAGVDLRGLLAAALVLALAAGTSLTLIVRARGSARGARLLAAGVVGGVGSWSAQVFALAAVGLGAPSLAGGLTSLVLIVAGLSGACWVVANSNRLFAAIGGALCGLSVAAMHLVGFASGGPETAPFAVLSAMAASTVLGAAGGFVCHVALRLGRRWGVRAGAAVATGCAAAGYLMAMVAAPAAPPTASLLTLLTGLAAIGGVGVLGAALATAAGAFSSSNALDRLREAIDAMPDGLAFFDADDRLVVWNTRYAELNPEIASVLAPGRTFVELIRTELALGHYPEAVGREAAWLAERMAERRRLSSTIEQRTADGAWLRVQDRRTADGGLVTVVNDISDLKRDAAALAEARDAAEAANRAKSEFLANMSHEIRTPLNGVIGISEALARTGLDARQTELLQLVQSSSATLKQLLSDILDLARVESGRMEIHSEPFDLGRAIGEACRLYADAARHKGLNLTLEIAPEVEGWALGDTVRLKQVLTNLVSNAVKFTETGLVGVRATRSGERVRVEVEDTGVGFDPEARDRLFGRFEQADGGITRRFGGSGLGLAICRDLTAMMGGMLDCESEPGGGSCFILDLPLPVVTAPASEAAEPALTFDAARPMRVLLADDHATNRRVVELILASAGVDLTQTETGVEAVEAFRDGGYDLVLMDMQMPVMDGLTATREIRLHEAALGLPRTPVIMLTANALPEHVRQGIDAGADGHLAKPFGAADLLSLVASAAEPPLDLENAA